MTAQIAATVAALREAAREMEHNVEFNVNRTLRWSEARQRENNRLIAQSRELHERADRLEREADVEPPCNGDPRCTTHQGGKYRFAKAHLECRR